MRSGDRAELPPGLSDAYPMSALQLGIVYHTLSGEGETPYLNSCGSRVRGLGLDLEVFDRAVQDVVDRHAVLRTSFDLTAYGEAMQLVHAAATVRREVHDLRDLPEQERERRLRADGRRPFDLAEAPLLRCVLHRLAEDEFQCTVVYHQAVLDRDSLLRVLDETLSRYADLLADPGAPANAAPPSGAFAEYVAAERAAVDDAEHAKRWQDHLSGYAPKPLPAGGATAYGSIESPVPDGVGDALRELSGEAGVPVEHVLLAAHLKVLSLLTGDGDVATGVAMRPPQSAHEAHGAAGVFLNVLPIRVDVRGGRWLDLVRRVSGQVRAMLPYSGYPLARIVPDTGGAELFDSMVDFSDTPVPITHRIEPNDLTLSARFLRDSRTGRLTLALDHRRLDDEQATVIRDYYLATLRAMTVPDDRHESFSPLSAAERRRMLVDWNGPARDYARGCLHELIERQVRRTPDALAVLSDEAQLTYAELNARSNRLARELRDLGAGPESVVGVLAERDADMIVTLLGVLKSGAAYLPLDPGYPEERLRYLLDDARARLVVTRSHLAPRLPEGGWRVLRTDTRAADIARHPADDLPPLSTPANLAYVIYTSGSTGRPKGVQVPHSGLVNYLNWCVEGYASRGSGGAPVFSSFSFDMIVPNLYTPLIMGERVCMLPEELPVHELGSRLERLAPFSFIKMTPGHLDLLSEVLGRSAARNLAGTLVVGADAFPSRNLAGWRRLDPDTVVLNEYGPTEASVGNTIFHTRRPVERDLLPIGRAIPNTTMYVLDAAMNPVPVGVTGELFIGGECVVRGYAGRPALTASRFLPDPFGERAGARMYRTGDLGRWLPDGNLEFLGRVDDQVKLNGYRVEPGEVENVLATHPAVARSVAAILGEGSQRRLVGYYVPQAEVGEEELMAYLAERVPGYLLPSALHAIEAVPLNANGKVDRKALPDPRERSGPAAATFTSPRTPTEVALAAIWEDLLGVSPIGVEDDFAALGGDSILATRMAFRIRQDLRLDVAMADIRGSRDLAELAGRLTSPAANPPADR
ncbi:amino acid adenylation domain-containing protein [Nonomuraea thailandensis]|uniref:Amino acid adenylation domain-containing protein n=1 Tax=Nonomuraea thailandensis TaxID=1188745 RepID=A0A9X2K1J0_9ACTN|nr:amino acid adenylation domain-containing protein [Nonomuraea thailandensis]MCP2356364.1 amino acid adenylation domain-containing protein [Nonomuraea thailandensis]